MRILLATVFTIAVACLAAAEGEASRPNVLFIAVDDLRPELGCYGVERVSSPNIDRLAAEGLVLERAYCNVAVCGASRACLVTGIRATASRFTSYLTRADEDAPDLPTLGETFKAAGYTTLSFGKITHHTDDSPESWSRPAARAEGDWSGAGYFTRPNRGLGRGVKGDPTEYVDRPDEDYPDGVTATWAEGTLAELAADDRPFFLALGFLKPHLPFNAPTTYRDRYPEAAVALSPHPTPPEGCPPVALHSWGELRAYRGIPKDGPLDESRARELVRGYLACTSFIDAQIGRVLAALAAAGLEDDTIVVLWGDHGWNLGDHGLWCKHATFETSMRVPLILRVPGRGEGSRSTALVETVDLYPTLCALAGIPVPEHCVGLDLQPLLDDPEHQLREVAIGRYGAGDTLRSDRYRYAVFHDRRGKADRVTGEMLYDHQTDPDETVNLIDDPTHAAAAADLRARMAAIRADW